MNLIDKMAWIEIVEGRILSTRSSGKDTFYIPGGKRKEGESNQDALIREIKEELSVDLEPGTIKHLGTFQAQAHGKAEGIIVQMTCYTAGYSGRLAPSGEIEEMVWFTHKDKDKSSPVDNIIFDWLFEKNMILP